MWVRSIQRIFIDKSFLYKKVVYFPGLIHVYLDHGPSLGQLQTPQLGTLGHQHTFELQIRFRHQSHTGAELESKIFSLKTKLTIIIYDISQ